MLLRPLVIALFATACFAADSAPAVADAKAAACTPIAADQVPAPAKDALVKAGADLAKLATCTKDGVVVYCAAIAGADGTKTMVEVDAAGVAQAKSAKSADDCGCCAPAPAK